MAMLTLRISEDLNWRLGKMAEKTGRTKTYFVKKLIEDGLEDMEDEILMEIMWKEYIAEGGRPSGPGVPSEIVFKKLEQKEMEIRLAKAGGKAAKQTRSKSAKTD
jgi:RHH-type rel operon transcriptional repressor/antitoxin RelB